MKKPMFLPFAFFIGMATCCLFFFGCSESDEAPTSWPGDLDIDCETIPTGPFAGEVFTDDLGFVEDLAFDGGGNMVFVSSGQLSSVDATGTVRSVATNPTLGATAGSRYMPDGRLMVVVPTIGKEVVQIASDGTVTPFIDGFQFPNSVYADFTGTLWVTDSDSHEAIRVNLEGEAEVVASGEVIKGTNGVVYDERRRSLFVTTGIFQPYMSVVRVDFDASGVAGDPVVVFEMDDANGDGMAMDGCGNIYFADNFNPEGTEDEDKTSRIRRLKLDAAGNFVVAEIITEVPGSVTNFQWGSGDGFDSQSLYTIGFGGISYRIDVGVIGAPVPIPDFS